MESKKKMLFILIVFGKAQIKSKLFENYRCFCKGGYEVIVHRRRQWR